MAVLCRLSGSPSTSKAALPQASPMVRGNMTRHAIGHNGIACRPMSPFGGSRVQRAAKVARPLCWIGSRGMHSNVSFGALV